ncbi:bifunctional nicotinamidase/pyrazinamidase [soil metagenome]
MTFNQSDALLVIDLQNDFCPPVDGAGGALAVIDGHTIVPLINTLAAAMPHTILTQDWHPEDHISFATTHTKNPYEIIAAPYGPQVLWPDHCLQHSHGAAFHPALDVPQAELILRKGFRQEIDSYSAFLENDHTTPTGLAGYLRERGITRLFLCGLAYDFCVRYSALDGKALGFETIVIEDASKAVNLGSSVADTNEALAAEGILRIHSSEMLAS